MNVQNKNVIVICEGPSERAYLQKLNRYFEEEDIEIRFIPRPSEGGDYENVVRKYREIRKGNRKSEILIWVDWDIYQRNNHSNMDHYQNKPHDIPEFLFSYNNFEDFLSMHYDRAELDTWVASCVGRNHFVTPSFSREYMPGFIVFIGCSYKKGSIPIEITEYSLSNLQTHQEDPSIPIKCDFARVLFELIDATRSK